MPKILANLIVTALGWTGERWKTATGLALSFTLVVLHNLGYLPDGWFEPLIAATVGGAALGEVHSVARDKADKQ